MNYNRIYSSLNIQDYDTPRPKWAIEYKYICLCDFDFGDPKIIKKKIYEGVKFMN